MNVWQAIVLGLVQGLTEFLPVSSSGHLFLLEKYLGINDGSLSFEISLHLATLLAVVIFFWPKIKQLNSSMLKNIVLASLPLVLVAFLSQTVNAFSQSTAAIALALLITAVVNFFSWQQLKKNQQRKTTDQIDLKTALKIGFFQMLAIFPGVSRSGMTLLAALSSKIKSELAFQFVFLLSIQAILGAAAFDLLSKGFDNTHIFSLNHLLGMFTAFLSGLISLKLLKNLLNHNRFLYLAGYCLLLSLGLLLFY